MRRLDCAAASRRTVQEQRTGGAVSYVSFQVIKKRSPRAVCLCRCRAIGNGTLILGLLYRGGWKSQRRKDKDRFVLRVQRVRALEDEGKIVKCRDLRCALRGQCLRRWKGSSGNFFPAATKNIGQAKSAGELQHQTRR